MPPREDDPSISNDDKLWRRILESWLHKEPNGQVRPSSVAFIDRRSHELSVHVSRLTKTTIVLRGHPTDSLAEIPAAIPRANNHIVCADPIVGDPVLGDDPSHAVICPVPNRSISQRKIDARNMAAAAVFVVLRDPAVKDQTTTKAYMISFDNNAIGASYSGAVWRILTRAINGVRKILSFKRC